MRAYIALAAVLAILSASALATQPALAFNATASPFLTTDSTIFMFPDCNNGLTILEFNSLAATRTDNETFNLEFPLLAGGIAAGPSGGPLTADGAGLGTGASANILPFGPVDLAFPSLGQTVDARSAYERTYFFTDTFG